MKDLTNKIFKFDGKDYKIFVDGRKGSGSIGHGVILFYHADKPLPECGTLYELSGCYFYDQAPYFDQENYNKDNMIQEAL